MRLVGLDLLRILGVASVVIGHVYTGPLTHQWGYPWHVPLFFFLTGYFWTPGRSFRREASARTRTLLVPYATWLVVNTVVFGLLSGFSVSLVVAALWGGSRATGPFGAFWFITALFFTALLYRAIERLPPAAQWGIAGVGLLLCWTFPSRLDDFPLAIGMALPCLTYVLAGRLARTTTPSGSRGRTLGGILLLSGIVAIAVLPVGTIDVKVAALGTPVLGVAVSIVLCWGLTALARDLVLPRVLARATIALAAVAVTVVLTHTVAISSLRLEGVQPKIILLVALVGSWILALALHRLPGARFTIGAARRRRDPAGTAS
jgi:fucose 4-O-acetylase-like acetyltransferase